jgi:hypothetical protein
MTTDTTTPIDRLTPDALEVEAITRDWSEGYAEEWDYIEAPNCPDCGGHAEWIAGDDLPRPELAGDHAEETWPAWRCTSTDPECENYGAEIDPHESGAEGPMMNYSYALPEGFPLHGDEYEAASAIADLPLCVVRFEGFEGGFALALTGGGMDLTWEIAEAFTRLGYLPPLAYCYLPEMCGRGTLSNAGTDDKQLSERDARIIAACRRSLTEYRERATARTAGIEANLDRLSTATGRDYNAR